REDDVLKIVVAPDSFKGSISSLEAASVMQKAISEVDSTIHVIAKPMADGGEGTLQALLNDGKGKEISVTCTGPLGEQVATSYGIFQSKIAVIECAAIAGLEQ